MKNSNKTTDNSQPNIVSLGVYTTQRPVAASSLATSDQMYTFDAREHEKVPLVEDTVENYYI